MDFLEEVQKIYDSERAYTLYCRYRSSRLAAWRDKTIVALLPMVGRLVFYLWKDLTREDRDDLMGESCFVITDLVRNCNRKFESEFDFSAYFWSRLRVLAVRWKQKFEYRHYPKEPIENPDGAIRSVLVRTNEFEQAEEAMEQEYQKYSTYTMAVSLIRFDDEEVRRLCRFMLEIISAKGTVPGNKFWERFTVPKDDIPFYRSYCTLLCFIAEKRVSRGVRVGDLIADLNDALALGAATFHSHSIIPELLQILGFDKMSDFIVAFDGASLEHRGYTYQVPKKADYLLFLANMDIYLSLSKGKNSERVMSGLCNRYSLNEDQIRAAYQKVERRMVVPFREVVDRAK